MDQILLNTALNALKRAGKHGVTFRDLMKSCKLPQGQSGRLRDCIRRLESKGLAVDNRSRVYFSEALSLRPAVVTRLNKTYGFARFSDDETEVFIPGRYFMGALPGDRVLIAPLPSRGVSPEGQILKIVQEGPSQFTGAVVESPEGLFLRPDSLIRFDLPLSLREAACVRAGDKVLCRIVKRGLNHAGHTAKIIANYGDSQTAVHCAQAILDLNGIEQGFPEAVMQQAGQVSRNGILPQDYKGRTDFREEPVFTIDSADSKDLDDAVSIRKSGDFYELSVHIADVSHYVPAGSPLDAEAFHRGTSIYFADRVIPMLPPELSNGICSLNPGEDRLAFSCVMKIDAQGELADFQFMKSVIRSRVKGVYKEINALLEGQAGEVLREKYSGLTESILLMKELAGILTGNRLRRGAPEIETTESLILLDSHSVAVDIRPRTRGTAEMMIEEFMLITNQAAARLAHSSGIPFVYRVHEPPAEDKLENLREILNALGFQTQEIRPNLPASVLAGFLRQAKGTPAAPLVNIFVLRAMSKAKYYEQPIGHYGLVLRDYAQFTSPIRRYPDLMIHRVLGALIQGRSIEKLKARFGKAVIAAARQSTETELNAMTLERQCEDCYKAEYMKSHVGEIFEGVVSSAAPHGLYVELPNTVEGLVKTESLPEGEYEFDGRLEFKNLRGGVSYRIGSPVKVRCVKADVSQGNIDFELA